MREREARDAGDAGDTGGAAKKAQVRGEGGEDELVLDGGYCAELGLREVIRNRRKMKEEAV